jgi:hypothetical protein
MEDSTIVSDTEAIEEMVLEYFKFHGMTDSLKKFEKERKGRKGQYDDPEPGEGPALNEIWNSEVDKEKKENVKEKALKELQRQHCSVLQSARQIFSIAINCLQQLHNIKDVSNPLTHTSPTILA